MDRGSGGNEAVGCAERPTCSVRSGDEDSPGGGDFRGDRKDAGLEAMHQLITDPALQLPTTTSSWHRLDAISDLRDSNDTEEEFVLWLRVEPSDDLGAGPGFGELGDDVRVDQIGHKSG